MFKNTISKKPLLTILVLTILSTIILWLPFFANGKLQTVFANYDGTNYIIVEKCWYDINCIRTNFSIPLPPHYFAAHFPLYPAVIALFDTILPAWWAMLSATMFGNLVFAIAGYLVLKQLKVKNWKIPLVILLFLPARTLVLRSIGSPETLFMGLILLSIYFFNLKKYLYSAIFLALAQLTKSPAILLFVAYLITIFANKLLPKTKLGILFSKIKYVKEMVKPTIKVKELAPYLPLVLGPAVLLPLFWFYRTQIGDFWAYFNSGDNFHLFFPPYQAFVSSQSWLGGDFWLEDIIYIYLIGAVAVLTLIKKYRRNIVTIFPLVFFISTLFISHRDISRYSFPLYFFWVLAFEKYLNKKIFKIAFIIILPAIYLYAINFINLNTAPIADWTPYI
jgi:Gpi18-like mannosyltransferase